MGKLNKWKRVFPIIILAALVVLSASGCSSNPKTINSNQARNSSVQSNLISSSKLATPFNPIADKLLGTMNFPVYLPTYLPRPYQENKWHLNLETSENKFTIEIDQWTPDQRTGTGMWAGILSGNIGTPPESPLEKQFITEYREVKTINLPNGIKGKEYTIETNAGQAISWEIGQWSYFVAAQPGNGVDNTVNSASQIINIIGGNGLALSGSPGKLYYLYTGANHPVTEIDWKVNDSVWYQLIWQDDPSNAIKILRSMTYLGVGQSK